MASTAGLRVDAERSPAVCPVCGDTMQVRKTSIRRGKTLAHGSFVLREPEYICRSGCTVPADGNDRPLILREPWVARLLMPHSSIGYDLLVFIGRRRFLGHRQREEIRSELAAGHGIELSAGEVSELCKKFCVYLAALHRARAGRLCQLFEADGGWPLHVDATGEDGKGTLLVVYAGWRGFVLGTWKIPTERADAILKRLHETADLYGAPCSLMHDLGRAMIDACHTYMESHGGSVVDLVCHMHFVADIGKDLLEPSHSALRALSRHFKVTAHLREFVRDLGRKLGSEIGKVREQVKRWFAQKDEQHRIPDGQAGLGVVRALAQWALDYTDDGTDKGFPWDRPWYDFYARCIELIRASEAFLERSHPGNEAHKALHRLHRIAVTVRDQASFGQQAAFLASRARLLDELRQTLRIEPKPTGRNEPCQVVLSPGEAALKLHDIKADLDQFTRSLRQKTSGDLLDKNTRAAITVILTHLDKYGPQLFGHLIELPASCGGGIRIVERTNVILESLFHELKHGMRRCSGRKNLGQDLENRPPEAVFALNLLHQDYLDVLCDGSLDNLAAAFATLDEGHRDKSLPSRVSQNIQTLEIVSSSMPTIDRRLVRTETVAQRIAAAASNWLGQSA